MMGSLPINSVRIDGGTQPRAATDQSTINDYRDALQAGARFPPVVVFYDGTDYWLADGFHRHAAHVMRAMPEIDAEIRQGTRRDAVLYSVGANSSHGLRRTNEDKRRAVLTLLRDEEWVKWSDNQIAKRAHVSPTTVGSLRRSLSKTHSEAEPPSARTYITKHGTTATMSVANIGRPANDNQKAPPQASEPPVSGPVLIGGAILYCGDCRAVLPTLGEVSHIICDPPYEANAHRQGRVTHASIRDGVDATLTFDAISEDLRHYVVREAKRLSGGWFLAFCQAEGVAPWRDAIEMADIGYRHAAVWTKPDASPKFSGDGPAPAFENMVLGWCAPGNSVWNGRGKRGVYQHAVNSGRHGGHQTEKPLTLLRELLLDFLQPGDTVLDPFMGIGSLGVACLELGRRYIGIEMDAGYFDIACKRMHAVGAMAA
jgi:site-specific DNA-methyltransferase (adenine-specific)